jgi:hypothetical protein
MDADLFVKVKLKPTFLFKLGKLTSWMMISDALSRRD